VAGATRLPAPHGVDPAMSTHIGDRLPAPVRFEFGLPPGAGEQAKAVILGSIDEDGSIRFALLSTAEISSIDDKHLGIALAADGRLTKPRGATHDGRSMFEVEIESVWRDFRPDAPMTCGPMYRAPQAD
jgi:hypothetical protein